jgi:3-keto-5-aminohexanoate cleavage enzyme
MMTEISKSEPLIIQLAPTGMILQKSDNPSVPISPDEIAADVSQCYKLGVSVVHVHARHKDGTSGFEREIYEEIFEKIRKKCPEIIICASTSGRGVQDMENRCQVLDLMPEMATLTVGTVNFVGQRSNNTFDSVKDLADRMGKLGIKPEIEIFERGFINTALYLAKKGHLTYPLHFNLLLGSLGSIPAELRDLVYLVDSIPEGNTWGATGIGRFQIGINAAAIIMGGHVRVGLEDALYYHQATRELATNENLIKRVVRIAGEVGREIATPKEARRILSLTPGESL